MYTQCSVISHMRQLVLQFLHFLQSNVLGLCVLQQSSNIEHVVQVGLDLHRQLVTLCVLGFLTGQRAQDYK